MDIQNTKLSTIKEYHKIELININIISKLIQDILMNKNKGKKLELYEIVYKNIQDN